MNEWITEKMENSMFKCIRKWLGVGDTPAVITETELNKMTKKEIEDWAAVHGINFDRRLTKAKMIDELKNHAVVD